MDGNISVQIISKPETETQYVLDDPLLSLIRQIVRTLLYQTHNLILKKKFVIIFLQIHR